MIRTTPPDLMAMRASRKPTRRLSKPRRLADRTRESALARLREHQASTSTLMGLLLHDAKNLLTLMHLTTANLETDLQQAALPVQLRLKRLQASVRAVSDLLDRGQAIGLSSPDAPLQTGEPLEVSAFIQACMAEQGAADRLQFRGPASHWVTADAFILKLLVCNLIDNALRHAAPASPVLLTLQVESTRWRLVVTNAVGPAGQPDPRRVFTPGYQAAPRLPTPGQGLGLFGVRGVARFLGGDVRHAAHDDQVEFSLCLPN